MEEMGWEKGEGHMGGLKEHHQDMKGYDEKGQGSLGIESGKGYQGQQGFLQVAQQQKEE